VWRPSTGTFYWLTSSSGYANAAHGEKQWGGSGDTPFLRDVDGDAKADLMVWRPTNGTFYWLTSSSGLPIRATRNSNGVAMETFRLVGIWTGMESQI